MFWLPCWNKARSVHSTRWGHWCPLHTGHSANLTGHHRICTSGIWKHCVDHPPFVVIASCPFSFAVPTQNSTQLGDGWCSEQNNIPECSEYCCLSLQAVSLSVCSHRVTISPLVAALKRKMQSAPLEAFRPSETSLTSSSGKR